MSTCLYVQTSSSAACVWITSSGACPHKKLTNLTKTVSKDGERQIEVRQTLDAAHANDGYLVQVLQKAAELSLGENMSSPVMDKGVCNVV